MVGQKYKNTRGGYRQAVPCENLQIRFDSYRPWYLTRYLRVFLFAFVKQIT